VHLSDTLVLGPLPLKRHPLCLPLGAALAGLLLLASLAATVLALGPLRAPIATLAARLPSPRDGLRGLEAATVGGD
jgi:hypothetical protein